jgi:hypothetical protein
MLLNPQNNRLPIRLRPSRTANTNASVGASYIFDDDGLAERASLSVGQNARDHIYHTAR